MIISSSLKSCKQIIKRQDKMNEQETLLVLDEKLADFIKSMEEVFLHFPIGEYSD